MFDTFLTKNKPEQMQLYCVPLMTTLLFLVANQIKFCLLDEGDASEANANANLFD